MHELPPWRKFRWSGSDVLARRNRSGRWVNQKENGGEDRQVYVSTGLWIALDEPILQCLAV
jgi:hypothetical protein